LLRLKRRILSLLLFESESRLPFHPDLIKSSPTKLDSPITAPPCKQREKERGRGGESLLLNSDWLPSPIEPIHTYHVFPGPLAGCSTLLPPVTSFLWLAALRIVSTCFQMPVPRAARPLSTTCRHWTAGHANHLRCAASIPTLPVGPAHNPPQTLVLHTKPSSTACSTALP
jgi:hypothetical protein